ncbi:MAG: hypothetical protein K6F39_02070 [Lachnospiraceae bacterium]|nr:hypothetical protein [Lachnospiraceae bacterium]
MFNVRTKEIYLAGESLEEDSRRIRKLNESLEDVISKLSTLSGMEEVVKSLRTTGDQLVEEKDDFDKMAQALIRISQCYDRCEDRLAENIEMSSQVYKAEKASLFKTDKANETVWSLLR